MPWLPIYADEEDFRIVQDYLNQNEEIAFIVPDGKRLFQPRWRAIRPLLRLQGTRICLWHVPSGPLSLVHQNPAKPDDVISDPWKGWVGLPDRGHDACPFFGAGHPGVIWLNHRPVGHQASGNIGLSSFEWIGNRYAIVGNPACGATEKFWQRLRHWVKERAIKIPRLDGMEPEIWALPSAMKEFRNGRGRDHNP